MLNEKLRGLGGSEFEGVVEHVARRSLGQLVAKETGQARRHDRHANLLKMRARCWGYGRRSGSRTTTRYPQLAVLSVGVGTAGALVYQQSHRRGPPRHAARPADLLHRVHASRSATSRRHRLVNWSQYLEGTLPAAAVGRVDPRAVREPRARVQVLARNAGAPWWSSALTPNKSTTPSRRSSLLDAR
jgi:hypothetical protein